ncbi:MAG: tetratricopeptide repeat protein [Eubacteriales bacterium]
MTLVFLFFYDKIVEKVIKNEWGSMVRDRRVNKISIGILMVVICLCTGCTQKEATTQIRQAMALLEAWEYEQAKGVLVGISTNNQEEKRVIARGLGLAYMGLAQYQEAVEWFEEALSYSNGIIQEIDYDINYYMASSYSKMGDYNNAIDIYDTLIRLRPKERGTYYLKGVALVEQGLIEEACNNFEQAIMGDIYDYDMLIAVGQQLSKAGEPELGKSYMQESLNQVTSNADKATLGKIYYYLEDYNEAKFYLDQVKGSSEEVTLMLGKTYEVLGDPNYAMIVYEDYLRTNLNSAMIYNSLAMCLMSQERYEEALKTVQNALNRGDTPMTQTLQYNEIVIYEYLEKFTQAASLMKTYLEEYPDDEKALREDQFLQTR